MTTVRLGMRLLPACALVVSSACSSTGHMPVSDYPLVPPTDLAAAVERPDAAVGLDRPTEGQSIADWTATWIHGPASTLATEEEIEAYQHLDGTGSRHEFIRLFWQRRIPPPSLHSHRAVDTARRRTLLAEELFGGEGTPGWRTPFGAVLLVLGTPVVIEEGKLRGGPRTKASERFWARNGDQVLWQYGREAAEATSQAQDVFTAPHFVAFSYGTDGWSLECGNSWIAGPLSTGTDRGKDVVESPVSPNTNDRALANPFAANGYKASSDYSDGTPPAHVRRLGAACPGLFERVRSAWVTSTVPTGSPG